MSEPKVTLGGMDLTEQTVGDLGQPAHPPHEFLAPAKTGFVVNISRDMAVDEGLVAPTAEEAAERNELSAKWRAKRADARRAYPNTKAALDALSDPAVRAVLTLHAPDETGRSVVCSHCYYDTEMGDKQDWPCETVEAIASASDIALPETTVYTEDDTEPYVWREGVKVERFVYKPTFAFCDIGENENDAP
jgi:hypothetical protein